MRVIEAMKEMKRLAEKVADLKKKIATYCADYDHETPAYADQEAQVAGWLQSVSDSGKRALELRIALQRTNLATNVTIELGGKQVTKTIAEWIHRKRDLHKNELEAWMALTDKGLREGIVTQSDGTKRDVKLRRYYKVADRDKMVGQLREEPSIIDATMEIVNATTKLIETAA